MTITEANHTARLLRFAAGQHAGTPEQIRESFAYLTGRAEKPLQVTISIDPHAIDAAIQAGARR
ncbi:hypothetical protein GON03_19195 [Nocardioides sp. MAH-18]|uniref:Uncharacterized protein n=1 Tax=Nocardioides agri TaxID=2682843 RepID=A0A6L6XX03_9ACTN|nr:MULTISPECIES: hypothetical protein [unclassified Nocardioides]MBA2952145.1 hypothetical protein [Nocardioides sp. CGMCC 1.13656]MVQ51312.1 hypothetical protein [Nocardioides sp. MAH-18]